MHYAVWSKMRLKCEQFKVWKTEQKSPLRMPKKKREMDSFSEIRIGYTEKLKIEVQMNVNNAVRRKSLIVCRKK